MKTAMKKWFASAAFLGFALAAALVAGLAPSARAANLVITFDDPAGTYSPGNMTEKGFRIWTDDPTFLFAAVNWYAGDPDKEINAPGNLGRMAKIAKLDGSPFTLVSFWTAGLSFGGPVTVRAYNAANAVVATLVYTDHGFQTGGIVTTLDARFSNVTRVELQGSFRGGGVNNHMLDDITILGAAVDTTPPVVTAPAPLTAECNTAGGILSSDPAIQAWLGSASATDNIDGPLPASNDLAAGLCALGSKTVTFSATDAAGNTGSAASTLLVRDSQAPTISNASASPSSLWPANHKLANVSVSVDAADACDASVTCAISSVASNEPADGLGDGDTAPDYEITGALTLDLRAERSGSGSGREYAITVTCTDDSGNAATRTVSVAVPHSRGEDRGNQ